MASSSALQLADLALTWSNTTADADLAVIDDDLASDRGLTTAVLLSLFTDHRAEDDDVPPSGDATDRRGWWADEFSDVEGDKIGSRLWLLDRGTLTNETKLRVKQYVVEALAWMIDDKVTASIDVVVEQLGSNGIVFSVALQNPGKDPTTLRFQHAWEHISEDA